MSSFDRWCFRMCERLISTFCLASPVVLFWLAGTNNPEALMKTSVWFLALAFAFALLIGVVRMQDPYFMRFWHKWITSHDDNTPTMWTHRFFEVPWGPWRGWKVELHKMVKPDAVGRYHTHPYKAYRRILWGGYIEQGYIQLTDGETLEPLYTRHPGFSSWIYPDTCHRIAGLLGRASYSLWVSGLRTHEVKLKGDGWSQDFVPYSLGSVPRDRMGVET